MLNTYSKSFILFLAFACIIFLFLVPAPDEALGYTLQVPIGGESIAIGNTTAPVGRYMQLIYKYAMAAVGILAVAVMMFGGVLWIIAFGNPTRIGEAKAWIGAALTGLVLMIF